VFHGENDKKSKGCSNKVKTRNRKDYQGIGDSVESSLRKTPSATKSNQTWTNGTGQIKALSQKCGTCLFAAGPGGNGEQVGCRKPKISFHIPHAGASAGVHGVSVGAGRLKGPPKKKRPQGGSGGRGKNKGLQGTGKGGSGSCGKGTKQLPGYYLRGTAQYHDDEGVIEQAENAITPKGTQTCENEELLFGLVARGQKRSCS